MLRRWMVALVLLVPMAAAPAAGQPRFDSNFQVVFDFVPVGTTSPVKDAIVRNTGDSANRIRGLDVIGRDHEDFLVARDGCSGQVLQPGDACRAGIAFRPSAAGTRIGSLRITDDTPCQNFIVLAGSGTSTAVPRLAHAASCYEDVRDACVAGHRFTIRLREPRGARIRSATARYLGKTASTAPGGRTLAIDLGDANRATVSIVLRTTDGRRIRQRRGYMHCAAVNGAATR